MRILISLLSFRPGKIGGTETYLRSLIPKLVELANDDEIVLLVNRSNANEIVPPNARIEIVDGSETWVTMLRVGEALTPFAARRIERTVERIAPDVAFFPQQSIFPARVRCPAVLMVHDLIHEKFPDSMSALDRYFRSKIYPISLARADHFIANSDVTRKEFLRDKGIPSDKITTVRLGYEPINRESIEPYQGAGDGKYLYFPAVSHPHKGHETLFRTVARLKEKNEFPWRLLLTGNQTPHWQSLESLINQLRLDETVEHLGYVSRAEVLSLHRGAEAVVFPSRYEGFGLPILEATTIGRKIIASQLEVFEELGVPNNFRIDFRDPQSLRIALAREPEPLTRKHNTWKDAAAATLTLLRRQANPI